MYHLWDGFDHYDAAHERWSQVNGSMLYSSAYSRFGAAPNCVAQGLKVGAGGGNWKMWNMVSNQPTMIFCFPFQIPTIGNGAFLEFLDNGTYQCSLCISAAGALFLCQGGGGTLGATLVTTAPGVITPLTWYWLDVLITIGALGSITVYINQPLAGGVAALTLGGINTRQSSNSYMNQFRIGDASNVFGGIQFDDFHAHDITGAAPNSILGAGTRIYTKMPIAPGALANWTPTGAGANWGCVQEVPPDDDATYVLAGSSVEDNYGVGLAGIGASNTVNGIVRCSRMRMDDAGPHTFQNGVRSNGVDQLATAVSVASGYGYAHSCSVIDPNTGLPWTAAAAEIATPIIYRTT